MKNCPDCFADIADGAEVCRACGNRVVGKRCPDCAELVRDAAKKCPHCSHSFAREQKIATVEAFSAKADLLPTILLRGRLIPQEIHLSSEKIVIQTWGLFWLSRTDEDIPWEKIAGYHYHSGLLWDSVEIQTRGQKANSIGCLPKASGARIKEILERMKE
jgi:RNA polymerase subunit RPABC4/transcription elongation factor Spt4